MNVQISLVWKNYKRNHSLKQKEQLTLYYLPLVKVAAIKLAQTLPSHINRDDLISAGVLGLISSIEKFKPEQNVSFKSFASFRITGAMLDELRKLDWVPRSVRHKSKKLQEAYNTVEQKLGRFATDPEVAEYLEMDLGEFDALVQACQVQQWISLDAKLTSKYSRELPFSEFVKDSKNIEPLEALAWQEQKELILESLKKLSKTEYIVLTLYYYEELTFKEIGHVIGVTESRISQIHTKAIMRLKSKINQQEVFDYANH